VSENDCETSIIGGAGALALYPLLRLGKKKSLKRQSSVASGYIAALYLSL